MFQSVGVLFLLEAPSQTKRIFQVVQQSVQKLLEAVQKLFRSCKKAVQSCHFVLLLVVVAVHGWLHHNPQHSIC